jgi:hypothetical protein
MRDTPNAQSRMPYSRAMRIKLVLTLLITVTATARQRGVFLDDINKSADACTNFFDYANGAGCEAGDEMVRKTRCEVW